jgi:hypothetical protein
MQEAEVIQVSVEELRLVVPLDLDSHAILVVVNLVGGCRNHLAIDNDLHIKRLFDPPTFTLPKRV